MHQLETIVLYLCPPQWTLKASLHIDIDKDSAEEYHLQLIPLIDQQTAQFDTDGSEINEEIGAAMYTCTERYTQQQYLGTSSESKVYGEELEAILMAITYTWDLTRMQSLICLKSRIFRQSSSHQIASQTEAKIWTRNHQVNPGPNQQDLSHSTDILNAIRLGSRSCWDQRE
jgi:hypothetical protein